MNFIKYNHHGADVWVREDLKGKHWDNCLCAYCQRFIPGLVQGDPCACKKASLNYAVCIAEGMTLPVFECPDFIEGSQHERKKNDEIHKGE